MKVLVTAGSTIVPIDKVRVISNIFGGRTGTAIAEYFFSQGDEVTLITSNPLLVNIVNDQLRISSFKTYNDLIQLMEDEIVNGNYDVVIHSAAVSDYTVAGVYIQDENDCLVLVDNDAKISSSHDSLFMEMKPTLKIIDLIRDPWGFQGQLVKFKLEVGISEQELIEIAKSSRETSDADFIVANCLEWSRHYAYIVNRQGGYRRTVRKYLPKKLRKVLL